MNEIKEFIERNWFATTQDAERVKEVMANMGVKDITFKVPSLGVNYATITYDDVINYAKTITDICA